MHEGSAANDEPPPDRPRLCRATRRSGNCSKACSRQPAARALAKAITLLESTRARPPRARRRAARRRCCRTPANSLRARHHRRARRRQVDLHRGAGPAPDRRRAIASRCSRSTLLQLVSGGSILGDKTRMERLSHEPAPSSGRARRAARWAAWPRRRARRCWSARRPATTS